MYKKPQEKKFKSQFNIPIAREVQCNRNRTSCLVCTSGGCPPSFWSSTGTPSAQRTCSTKNPLYRERVYSKLCPQIFKYPISPVPDSPSTPYNSSLYSYTAPPVAVSFLVGTWKLDPNGLSGTGPAKDDTSWFTFDSSNSSQATLFDDKIVFNEDGTFNNIFDGNTYIYTEQGGSNGPGIPVAPHDNSNSMNWSYDGQNVTLVGIGAHLGNPLVYNNGQFTDNIQPLNVTSRIYEVNKVSDTEVVFYIEGTYWWKFSYIKVT